MSGKALPAGINAFADAIDTARGDAEALAVLANSAYVAGERYLIQRWIEAGQALLAARECVPHGEWKPWVAANWTQSYRQAMVCMQIAGHWLGLATKSQRAALLDCASVRQALDLIPTKGQPAEDTGPQLPNPSGATVPNVQRAAHLPEAPAPIDAEFTVRPDTVTTGAEGSRVTETPFSGRLPAAPPPSLSVSVHAASVVAHIEAAESATRSMTPREGSDRAHALVARALPLLVEAGIYRLEITNLSKPVQASEGVLWRFEEELDFIARKLARRWRENDPDTRAGLVARAEADYTPRTALPATPPAIAALRRSPLNSDAIRDVVYETPSPTRSWQGGLYEAEQHVVLLLRDAWAVLEARIARAPAGASSVQALRDLRAALTPLVTQAEAAAREACGPDRPDPLPKPPGRRKKAAAGEGLDGQDDAGAPAGEDA